MTNGDWTTSMEKATIKITKQIFKSAKWNFQDWIKHYSWYWKALDDLNIRKDTAEERISELRNRGEGILWNTENKKRKDKGIENVKQV